MQTAALPETAKVQNPCDQPARRPAIDSLTSLRFFAAALVVLCHSSEQFIFLRHKFDNIAFGQAVTFFFVLSGFILTYNYSNIQNAKECLKFYVSRIARIWPAHAFCLLMIVLLVPEVFHLNGKLLPSFVSNLFLIHAWIPSWQLFFSFNSPSWSISTELFFYLAFPALVLLLRKRWWAPVLLGICLSLAMLCVCYIFNLPAFDTSKPSVQALIYIHPVARILDFTIGMTCAIWWHRSLSSHRPNFFLATTLECATVAFVITTMLTSCWLAAVAKPLLGIATSFWLENSGLALVAAASLICVFSYERGAISKLLNLRAFVLLGEISFAIYMLHAIFLAYSAVNFPLVQSTTSCFLYWATLLVAAHLTWLLVERPAQKIIKALGETAVARSAKTNNMQSRQGSYSILRRSLIPAEMLILALLMYFSLPTINVVSDNQAINCKRLASTHDVEFAPHIRLVSANATTAGNGVVIRTVWQTLKSGPLSLREIIRLIDKDNATLSTVSFSVDPRRRNLSKGQLWQEDFELPNNYQQDARYISIQLTRGGKLVPCVQRGKVEPSIRIPLGTI